MKFVNDFRIEKDNILKEWVAFDKIGVSGWLLVHKSKKQKEIKDWAEAQPTKEKRLKKYENISNEN